MAMLWSDKKRHFGLPISFTKYSLDETRLFIFTGFLNQREEEIQLYRIRDVSLSRKLGQRMFGVGSVIIHSSDRTTPILELKNIKNSREVKEMISEGVEKARSAKRMRTTELLDDDSAADMDVE